MQSKHFYIAGIMFFAGAVLTIFAAKLLDISIFRSDMIFMALVVV